MQSRLVTLIIIFCVSSSILIGRLFYLQIVKGSDYLENYEYSIRRTTSVAATRGNIYDRNGNLLAYNQLAYSVTINLSTVENSITTDKRSEKNAALNKILDQVLSIVAECGSSGLCERQRRHQRGTQIRRQKHLYRTVPSGGMPWPAGFRIPV